MNDPRLMIPLLRNALPNLMAQSIVGVQPMPDIKYVTLTLPKPKYKFSRANWYVAEFDTKYYFEVDKWCTEQFGPHPKNPDAWCRWFHKYEDKIHFRDEKDYVLFVLRWQ